MSIYSKLTHIEKLTTYQNLALYNSVCREVMEAGESLLDSPTMIWRMLQRLKVKTSDDLFSNIKPGHIVEVYTQKHTQIFRNFRFFEVCSYSIEELYATPWWKLFWREESITQRLFQTVSQAFEATEKKALIPEIPTHELREMASMRCFHMSTDVDFFYPLFQGGEVKAMLAVERVYDVVATREMTLDLDLEER